jgi:hypothetical protein
MSDDEIMAEVEKKVVQMIGNFTHKEWECAQKILKHQGRVNRVFDEMGVTYSPRSVPPTACKKMQPPGNIGSEAVETSRKTKSGKTTAVVDSAVKNTKAQDILAKRKADAAKATLPPLAEKSTKLLKVNETLAHRKAEAAKVAAAEREKKKTHDPTLAGDVDKRLALKKRPLETTERAKRITLKEKEPHEDETSGKRARIDPVAETDEGVDIMPMPQIQPCTNYPPKGSAQKLTEEPSPAGLADAEELEAREARGKRVTELIQKEIAMADAFPKERVAGHVDVVDESEDLCYINDDTTQVGMSSDAPLPQPQCDLVVTAVNLGEGSGAKAQDPIDLDAPEVGDFAAHASRSPPPVSDDFDPVAAKPADVVAPEPMTTPEALQPEDAGMMLLLRDGFSCPSYLPCISFAYTSRFRANFSGENSSHPERQRSGEEYSSNRDGPFCFKDKSRIYAGRARYETSLTALFLVFRLGAFVMLVMRRDTGG